MINPFKHRRKLKKFEGKGLSSGVEKEVAKREYSHVLITKGLLFAGIIIGAILCFCDIRDDGMMLEISWDDNLIKYAGTLIGVVISIICIIGVIIIKPEIKLEH